MNRRRCEVVGHFKSIHMPEMQCILREHHVGDHIYEEVPRKVAKKNLDAIKAHRVKTEEVHTIVVDKPHMRRIFSEYFAVSIPSSANINFKQCDPDSEIDDDDEELIIVEWRVVE